MLEWLAYYVNLLMDYLSYSSITREHDFRFVLRISRWLLAAAVADICYRLRILYHGVYACRAEDPLPLGVTESQRYNFWG